MRKLGSVIFVVVWFPTFAVAFIPMVMLLAFVDAYRIADKVTKWIW